MDHTIEEVGYISLLYNTLRPEKKINQCFRLWCINRERKIKKYV